VVLAYRWRSVVYNIGKEHGQNRGPTQAPTHNRGYMLQGARVSLANVDSRYREDFPLHSHLV
jgi:hypothetical protein